MPSDKRQPRTQTTGFGRTMRRQRRIIPAGQLVESLEFYISTMRVGVDGEAGKDLELAFEAKGQVVEQDLKERSFRHINVGDEEITHKMVIAYRSEFRDEMIIRWGDDFFTITRSTEIKAQNIKYQVFGCRKNGDILLNAAKA